MFGLQAVKAGVAGLCAFVVFSGFVALGNWQLERRVWKLDLIERVNERAHAPATPAPARAHWTEVSKASDEYRRVFVSGHFLPGKESLVVAATELGSGYWVLTPLQRPDGSIVYINRGYVAQGVEPAAPPSSEVQLVGLLRVSEPGGSVLRSNIPASGRWYSRDIDAIAAVHQLKAAPFFIDAASAQPGSRNTLHSTEAWPVGGLTVIQFHNSHLIYAVTWYGLAIMVLGACFIVWRESRRAGKQ